MLTPAVKKNVNVLSTPGPMTAKKGAPVKRAPFVKLGSAALVPQGHKGMLATAAYCCLSI